MWQGSLPRLEVFFDFADFDDFEDVVDLVDFFAGLLSALSASALAAGFELLWCVVAPASEVHSVAKASPASSFCLNWFLFMVHPRTTAPGKTGETGTARLTARQRADRKTIPRLTANCRAAFQRTTAMFRLKRPALAAWWSRVAAPASQRPVHSSSPFRSWRNRPRC